MTQRNFLNDLQPLLEAVPSIIAQQIQRGKGIGGGSSSFPSSSVNSVTTFQRMSEMFEKQMSLLNDNGNIAKSQHETIALSLDTLKGCASIAVYFPDVIINNVQMSVSLQGLQTLFNQISTCLDLLITLLQTQLTQQQSRESVLEENILNDFIYCLAPMTISVDPSIRRKSLQLCAALIPDIPRTASSSSSDSDFPLKVILCTQYLYGVSKVTNILKYFRDEHKAKDIYMNAAICDCLEAVLFNRFRVSRTPMRMTELQEACVKELFGFNEFDFGVIPSDKLLEQIEKYESYLQTQAK